MTSIAEYLRARYGGEGPDDKRFEPDPDVIHSSHVAECQRKRKWSYERQPETGPSSYPYFETGRLFESLYGAALVNEFDPDVSIGDVKFNKPHDVVAMSQRVHQDVNIEIELGECTITGEMDWLVMQSPWPKPPDTFHFDPDEGTRKILCDGEPIDPETRSPLLVVETKTTYSIDTKEKYGYDADHEYQLRTYMWAVGISGRLTYLERNELQELAYPFERDSSTEQDIRLRALRHHRNYDGDEVPPTTPLDAYKCRYCDFCDECEEIGGSRWGDD